MFVPNYYNVAFSLFSQQMVIWYQQEEQPDLEILKGYHQSDAYQRLLKRQAQAVRRLERIKANFERKRRQVNNLAIMHQSNQEVYSREVMLKSESQDNGVKSAEMSFEDGQVLIKGNMDQRSRKQVLMHAPFGAIVGKTQQISSNENRDTGNLPLSHSQVVYKRPGTFGGFQQVNQSFNATASFANQNLDLSQPPQSTAALSENYRPFMKARAHFMDRQKVNNTFLDLYHLEIAQYVQKFKILYIWRNSIVLFTSLHLLDPYTKGNKIFIKKIRARQEALANVQDKIPRNISTASENLRKNMLSRQSVPSNNDTVLRPNTQEFLRNRAISNQGGRKRVRRMIEIQDACKCGETHATDDKVIVEMAEEVEDNSRYQTIQQHQTLTKPSNDAQLQVQFSSEKKPRPSAGVVKLQNNTDFSNELSIKGAQKLYNSTMLAPRSFGSTGYVLPQRRQSQTNAAPNYLMMRQGNQLDQQTKAKSATQRYQQMRTQILKNIKSKQYWPQGMTHPDEYRVFYWAPDMSFCGFAANHIFKANQKVDTKKEVVPQLANEFKKSIDLSDGQ